MTSTSGPDVIVVGGGLIGLATAWRTTRRGRRVTVIDPNPLSGASHASAGMLAPVTELHYGEEALLRLNLAAAERYPRFIAELEDESGQSTGFRECGTLAIALDADDLAVLHDLLNYQRSLGLAAESLTARDCRRLEPMLAPSIRGGILVAGDHQVDNRLLGSALMAAARRSGAAIRQDRAVELVVEHDRAAGVRVESGDVVRADTVVLAAGCWSGDIGGVPASVVPPVRPVKGQILRVQVPPAYRPFLSRTVRGMVRGSPVYLVPREHGELVIGATMEERGYDTTVTAGGVYELLRDAHELAPGITELPLAESLAGLRPGSPDNAPIIGPTTLPGLMLATGHFRNGVLLTPITADALADLLLTGEPPDVVAPFTPTRFPTEVPAR